MWIELHSALFTLISTVIISAGLYKKRNISKLMLMVFTFATVTVNFFANSFLPHYLSVIAFVGVTALILIYGLRQSKIQAITIALVISFLHRIIMLLYFVCLYVFCRDNCDTRGLYSLIYSMVFINVVSVIVVWLYYKYRNVQNISEQSLKLINSMNFLIITPKAFGIMYIAVSLIDTLFIGICTNIELSKGNNPFYTGAMFVVVMYSLLMVLTLIMMQGLLKNEIKLTTKEDEVESLKHYTETIENLVDEMQKSRHDYKNMLLSIREYVVQKKVDELEIYYNDQILKSENIEKVSKNIYLSTKQIKNLPFKSIINAKLNEALSNGIKVEITIFNEITIESVSDIDVCRIIGNLLDNAVDSALKSEDKVISIIMLKNDNQYSITLCNSFDGEVDLSKIWKKGYSTKGKNRGLGLSIVKKIIEKEHTNILLNTEIKNNLFVQDITIIEQ